MASGWRGCPGPRDGAGHRGVTGVAACRRLEPLRLLLLLRAAGLCQGAGSLRADVASAEIYTTDHYRYGRFEASVQFAPHNGIVSSFFLWKKGSARHNTFWSELDFEKVGLNTAGQCKLSLNVITGMPGPVDAASIPAISFDICSSFHTYTFEWTPTYIAWYVDGVEYRRETGALFQAFERHAAAGVQPRFNVWPGDLSFGGAFNQADLPVYQYIDWVRYSAFEGGAFRRRWLEKFNGNSLPRGWIAGTWASPKGRSVHRAANVILTHGCAVLALTRGSSGLNPQSIPAPTARASVGLSLTLGTADATLPAAAPQPPLGAVESALRAAVAAAAGQGVTPDHVVVEFAAPAKVRAWVTPPDGVIVQEVQHALSGAAAGDLQQDAASRLRSVGGAGSVAGGSWTVGVMDVKLEDIRNGGGQ